MSPIPPIEQNHERNSHKAAGDISNAGDIISPIKNTENHVQKLGIGGTEDSGGIFPTLQENHGSDNSNSNINNSAYDIRDNNGYDRCSKSVTETQENNNIIARLTDAIDTILSGTSDNKNNKNYNRKNDNT